MNHPSLLEARLAASAQSSPQPNARAGSRSLFRRWYDPRPPVAYNYTPLSIPGDSTVVTKYHPPGISDPHTVAALAILSTVGFVSIVGFLAWRIYSRRVQAREELKADIAYQALEKGMGGGSSPPMELEAPSLWGKGLAFFLSERRRGPWTSVHETEEGKRRPEEPRPVLLRERSSGSAKGSSVYSSDGGHADQFGVLNRQPRHKSRYQREGSKLRFVRMDLENVSEGEEDGSDKTDEGTYPSSLAPSTPSSDSCTTFPSSTTSLSRSCGSYASLLPPSPTLPAPTSKGTAPLVEPLPFGSLRPLSVHISRSFENSLKPYIADSPTSVVWTKWETSTTGDSAAPTPATVWAGAGSFGMEKTVAEVCVFERRPSDGSDC